MNAVINLRIPWNAMIFLDRWGTVCFLGRTLLCGVSRLIIAVALEIYWDCCVSHYLLYSKHNYADCSRVLGFQKSKYTCIWNEIYPEKFSLDLRHFTDICLSGSDVETCGRLDISTLDAFTFHMNHAVERARFFWPSRNLRNINLCLERMLLYTWVCQYSWTT